MSAPAFSLGPEETRAPWCATSLTSGGTISDPLTQFHGDIPYHYNEGLGPILFEPFAVDLANRVKAEKVPKILLELAAGTGILTEKLARTLQSTMILASDLNLPMLDIARERLSTIPNARFAPADAMAIELSDECVDAMACQFGVMFFPDKVESFREARRVLKKGAPYWFNSWGSHEENPFAAIAYDTTAQLFPDDPPAFYKLPFSYPEPDQIEADLKKAGFTEILIETVSIDQPVGDWDAFTKGIVYGNPLHTELDAREGPAPEQVRSRYLNRLTERFGAAPSSMPLLAHVVRASA